MHIEQTEQCVCLSCSSVIPRENVVRRMLHAAAMMATRRVVRAWCDHCQRAYELTQILRDGHWIDDGDVQVIEDPKKLEGFKARLAHLRNERQASAIAG